jgi:uncharacterized protein
MSFFVATVTNKIVVSVVLAYFLSSAIKMFFNFLRTEKWDPMVFLRTGGMPSSHTASVTAMTTSIYLMEGPSNLFIVCFIVSVIVISDAVGMRRAMGKQAEVVNKIADEFKYFKKFRTKRLYELLGHTPKQVIAGLILGILIARFVHTLY